MTEPTMTEVKDRLERLAGRGNDPGVETLVAAVRHARPEHGSDVEPSGASRRRALVSAAIAFVAVIAITFAAVALRGHDRASTPPASAPKPTVVHPAPATEVATGSVSAAGSQPALVSASEGWICDTPLDYSRDGGATWRSIAIPIVGTAGRTCTFRAHGRAWVATYDVTRIPAVIRVVAGTHPHTTRVDFPGSTADAVVVSLAFADNDHGWALTTVNASDPPRDTLYDTIDGGRHWHLLAAGTPVTGSLKFTSATEGWAVAGSALGHTVDGGRTWNRVAATLPAGSTDRQLVMTSVFVFDDHIVAAGALVFDPRPARAFVDTSNDNGRTWSVHTFTSAVAQQGGYAIAYGRTAFSAVDASHWHIYLGGLWFTDDAGASWHLSPMANPLNGGSDGGISFLTPRVAWVSLCKGTSTCNPAVARTRDGGQTWTRLRLH